MSWSQVMAMSPRGLILAPATAHSDSVAGGAVAALAGLRELIGGKENQPIGIALEIEREQESGAVATH